MYLVILSLTDQQLAGFCTEHHVLYLLNVYVGLWTSGFLCLMWAHRERVAGQEGETVRLKAHWCSFWVKLYDSLAVGSFS